MSKTSVKIAPIPPGYPVFNRMFPTLPGLEYPGNSIYTGNFSILSSTFFFYIVRGEQNFSIFVTGYPYLVSLLLR